MTEKTEKENVAAKESSNGSVSKRKTGPKKGAEEILPPIQSGPIQPGQITSPDMIPDPPIGMIALSTQDVKTIVTMMAAAAEHGSIPVHDMSKVGPLYDRLVQLLMKPVRSGDGSE